MVSFFLFKSYAKHTLWLIILNYCTHTAPPELTISNPVVTATQGNFAQLTCTFVAPATIPIRVQWYRNNTLLFTGEKYSYITIQQNSSYTLVIHNLTNDDQGDYYCKADSNLNVPKTVGLISLIGKYLSH